MIETETKYKLQPASGKKIEKVLIGLGFEKQREIHEIDTYYSRPDVDYMETVECLRVRESGAVHEITYKPASTQRLSKIIAKKETNVTLEGTAASSSAKQLLENIGMIQLAVVDKRRQVFRNLGVFGDNISITIDRIASAGTFLEIEILGDDVAEARRAIALISRKLDLRNEDVVLLPYRDIVMQNLSQL